MGLTIRESLPAIDDLLREEGLRERIVLMAAGKLLTPAEVAWAFCAGADFVNSARGFMLRSAVFKRLSAIKTPARQGLQHIINASSMVLIQKTKPCA